MSKKFTPPKVAITRGMIDAGKVVLEAMTQGDNDNHTDDALVANVFFSMWEAYWQEIADVKAKRTPSALIAAAGQRRSAAWAKEQSGLILPMKRPH